MASRLISSVFLINSAPRRPNLFSAPLEGCLISRFDISSFLSGTIVCLIAVAVIGLGAAAMARAGADYFAAQKGQCDFGNFLQFPVFCRQLLRFWHRWTKTSEC
jgi:hypothetical protein